MPHGKVKEIIPASADAVFDLLHDYERRLEWDTLLQAAYLEPPFERAAKGAISVCRGRTLLGGFAVRTIYVSFERGRVAAVKMLNRPPFFKTFAASIRHFELGENSSAVEYHFNFTARPRVLRPLLDPVMQRVFQWETRKRLAALKNHFNSRANKKDAR